jgi:hypothetical protein
MKKSAVNAAAFALAAGSLLSVLPASTFAGSQERADKNAKEVAAEAEKQPFPIHFSLTAGIETDFVFRGVNILPEKTLNLPKATAKAIERVTAPPGSPAGTPTFAQFLQQLAGVTPRQFADTLGFPDRIKVARESDIAYFDGSISGTVLGTNISIGAFHAFQETRRIEPNFFGGKSFFTEYRETDGYFSFSRALGPINVNLGGTYYHVEKNSQFDTAELNFGLSYTPEQFRYVTASFSYDYAGSTKFPTYFDGHHLEARISGNIPVPMPAPISNYVTADFNPYVLVSAGSGILPRAFSLATLPTYFSDQAYSANLAPGLQQAYNQIVLGIPGGGDVGGAVATARSAFDPVLLDRDFNLSNFETGVRARFFITKYVTLTGKGSYSRPLGNLQKFPYNQKDVIWGGATLNFYF